MKTKQMVMSGGSSNAFRNLMSNRNFRLFWVGEGISVLGDHFYMIALPWLVLRLTGDSLAMGAVLAMAAVPRALLMLLGGALTDRFSPRGLMIGSNAARFILVGLITFLIASNQIELWALYIFAALFGVADAFFYPAQNSITPQIVEESQLQAANSVVHGTMMLAMLIGPALSGVLIAVAGDGSGDGVEMTGIALAMGLDALTFLVSLVSLWLIRIAPSDARQESEPIFVAIRSGLAFVWSDLSLRAFFFVVGALTLFFNGPFNIGVPLLADERFPAGALAYGAILSAWGGGSLIGMALAGALPRPDPSRQGTLLLSLVSVMGLGLGFLGAVMTAGQATGIGFVLGMLNGYINVFFLTWVQRRAPRAYLGRVMSLLAFASTGLYPVSVTLAGLLSRMDVVLLLGLAGGTVTLIGVLTALHPVVRAMETVPSSAD